MSQQLWNDVDDYFFNLFSPKDAVLENVIESISKEDMAYHQVSANFGRLLYILAKSVNAKSILEIGTHAGYSTICLARALSESGKLVTIEKEEKHYKVAHKNIQNAGLEKFVDMRLGTALSVLSELKTTNTPPFDFVFIDADKKNSYKYFEMVLNLSKSGTLIVVDNVVRAGIILDIHNTSASAVGARKLSQLISKEKRVNATAIQTVGSRGYDGFILAQVI